MGRCQKEKHKYDDIALQLINSRRGLQFGGDVTQYTPVDFTDATVNRGWKLSCTTKDSEYNITEYAVTVKGLYRLTYNVGLPLTKRSILDSNQQRY